MNDSQDSNPPSVDISSASTSEASLQASLVDGADSKVISAADVNSPQNVGVAKVDIDWKRAASWWKPITSTLPISWRLSHLCLSAIGVSLTSAYAYGVMLAFGVTSILQVTPFFWFEHPLEARHDFPMKTPLGHALDGKDSFFHIWNYYLEPLRVWFQTPSVQGAAACVALLLGTALIWGFIGGCLVRRSIVEIGTGFVPGWNDTVRWVRQRLRSILWALLMPVFGALMLCVIPLGLGLVSLIPTVGPWLAAVCMIPASLLLLAVGWTLVITLIGFPISISAIVTEKKADAFDGVSRAGAYVFQRPVLLVLFAVMFEGISRLGVGLFSLVVNNGYFLINSAFATGRFGLTSGKLDSDLVNNSLPVAWQWMPLLLTASFGVSYFWSAVGAMYLLLRKSVDSAELDQIDLGGGGPAPSVVGSGSAGANQ